MSLLLDALQRASREKDRGAPASVVAAQEPALSPPTAVTEPAPASVFSTSTAAPQFPSLSLEPEPLGAEAPPPAPPLAVDLSALALVPADPAQATPQPPSSPVPDTPPPPTPEAAGATHPGPASAPLAQHTAQAAAAPAAPALEARLPVAEASPATPPVPGERPAPAAPAPGSGMVGAQTPQERAARLAQQIRRAYAPAAPAGTTRVPARTWALAGVALVLAIAGGSVFMGVWGDPAELLGLGGGSTLAPTAPSGATPDGATPGALAAAAPTPDPSPPGQADASAPVAAPMAVASARPPLAVPKAQAPAPRRPPQSERSRAAPPAGAGLVASATGPAAPATAPVTPPPPPSSTPAATPVGPHKAEVLVKGRGPNLVEQAYAALSAGRLEEAQQAYEAALHTQGEDRDALWGLAYLAQRRGDKAQAQDYYRRVLRQDPGNTAASNALWALESEAVGEAPVQRAHDLVQRQPESAAALAAAATAMAREGQLGQAAQWWARAQALEPHNPVLAYNHAVTLDRMRQYPAALRQYEQAIRLAGSPPADIPLDAAQRRAAALRQALAAPNPP